jgi:hypothetical protein
MGTLIPRRTSRTFAGQDVKNPMIMPICIRNRITSPRQGRRSPVPTVIRLARPGIKPGEDSS